jgi:hypothetical protein
MALESHITTAATSHIPAVPTPSVKRAAEVAPSENQNIVVRKVPAPNNRAYPTSKREIARRSRRSGVGRGCCGVAGFYWLAIRSS